MMTKGGRKFLLISSLIYSAWSIYLRIHSPLHPLECFKNTLLSTLFVDYLCQSIFLKKFSVVCPYISMNWLIRQWYNGRSSNTESILIWIYSNLYRGNFFALFRSPFWSIHPHYVYARKLPPFNSIYQSLWLR